MLIAEQWVLVTGGARGLGQSITRALAREGAGVVINYHHSDKAEDLTIKKLTRGNPTMAAKFADLKQLEISDGE